MLHLLYHDNVVRVFNYYLYPDEYAGYIIMEYVKGADIEEYLANSPENIDSVFEQTLDDGSSCSPADTHEGYCLVTFVQGAAP